MPTRARNPDQHGSCCSRFLFRYANDLVDKGYEGEVKEEDVWEVHAADEPAIILGAFSPVWEEEQKLPGASLIVALRRFLFMRYVACVALKFGVTFASFGGPLVLGLILEWLSDEHASRGAGYGYACLLIVAAVGINMLNAHEIKARSRAYLKVRSIVMAMVYRKSLAIRAVGHASGADGAADASSGQIVNLMSSDADRVGLGVFCNIDPPIAIIYVLVALVLLYQRLGVAMFAGFGVMLAAIPIFGVIMVAMAAILDEKSTLADLRVKLVNEVLGGFRVVRFYAWEGNFTSRVGAVRTDEIAALWRLNVTKFMFVLVILVMPVFISLASFAAYTARGNVLDAATVFSALALFSQLRWALIQIPEALNNFVSGSVSARRVQAFLAQPDIAVADAGSAATDDATDTADEAECAIRIRKGAFAWSAAKLDLDLELDETTAVAAEPVAAAAPEQEQVKSASSAPFALVDIDFQVPVGALVAVVGAVGSGKTSLAMAVLGEMHRVGGARSCSGPVGYTAQSAWIQNMSVRDNILFGHALDAARYDRVVDACALRPDLESLPAGDATEIGERGVNLSGGQRARVALARAIYADAPVLLLDDPFAAVDANVGEHLFERCLRGELRGKSIMLITNQYQFLARCDRVVVMANGTIAASGTLAEVVASGALDASQFGAPASSAAPDVAAAASVDAAGSQAVLAPATAAAVGDIAVDASPAVLKPQPPSDGGVLIEDEERVVGSVDWSAYSKLLASMGGAPFLVCIVVLASAGQLCINATEFWLSAWVSRVYAQPDSFYLLVFGMIALGSVIALFLKSVVMARASVAASSQFHAALLSSVVHAPMQFFDTTPSGRILNRFSKDLNDLDVDIPGMIDTLVAIIGMVFFNMAAAVVGASPYFILVMLLVAWLYSRVQRYYQPAALQMERFEATSRSPLFQYFSETLAGTITIRAMGKQREFVHAWDARCESNITKAWMLRSVFLWATFRVEIFDSLLQIGCALFIVSAKGTIDPSFAGAALNQILSVAGVTGFGVNMATQLENRMVCVERMNEYSTGIGREPEWELDADGQLPSDWPHAGRVEFDRVTMRYRETLEPALRCVSAVVAAHEKLGVAGRTGSGKSSLMLTLFRLYPLCESAEASTVGRILIDGVDIATIGVHTLRRKLAIIPQDAFMFSGTLRDNLDPFGEYDDERLWRALDDTNLRAFVNAELGGRLDARVTEGGGNFSQGQRQLVCMARALLRRPKILILDEATSSVDPATDALIQTTVRANFRDATVLTIAHRLGTIADADRICVLDRGRLAEFDSPAALERIEGGLYASMWAASQH